MGDSGSQDTVNENLRAEFKGVYGRTPSKCRKLKEFDLFRATT